MDTLPPNSQRSANHPAEGDGITELVNQFWSATEKNQFALVETLGLAGEAGLPALMDILLKRQSDLAAQETPDLVAAKIYRILFQTDASVTKSFLQTHFPTGIVPLRSQTGIDYAPLQQLLAQQDFQAADQITLHKLCELAGEAAVQRRWVYFTEVDQFPATDLTTLDRLWLVHSEGKFGFSIQRELWLSLGQNWEKLWSKLGWKTGNSWTRYPQEFTWDLTAPKGHLPLSNQLRGVRSFAALLTHPVWSNLAE